MAEVLHNTTLENKINTIGLVRKNTVGEADAFDPDTRLFIKHLATGNELFTDGVGSVSAAVGSEVANVFSAVVDLSSSSLLDIGTDYNNPTHEYSYSVRTPLSVTNGMVYLAGKLNIIDIA